MQLIPIILPVYNQFPYIKHAIEWLLSKGYKKPEYTIAVINDGSTNPELLKYLDSISNENVEVHNFKDNKGCLTAFNRGILAYPNAKIYLIGNDDTYPMLDCIEQMRNLMHHDSRIGLISPMVNPISHKIQEIVLPDEIDSEARHFDFKPCEQYLKSVLPSDIAWEWEFANAPETSFYALRGDMVRKCGMWNDKDLKTNGWYSNIDYMARMRAKGYHGVILRSSFIYHFHASTNDWRKLEDQNHYNLNMVRRWFGDNWMDTNFQSVMQDDPYVDIGNYYKLWTFEYPRLLAQADRKFQREWDMIQPQNEQERNWWYGNSDAYMYKLIEWHRTNERRAHEKETMAAIEQFCSNVITETTNHYIRSETKILDFGGGIGQTVINIARSGFQAYYYDILSRYQEFAKWRARDKGLDITFLDKLEGKYEVICSIDVLEHINNPFQLVQRFHDHLEDSGILILEINFSKGMGIGNSKGYGEHLEENMQYYTDWRSKVQNIGFEQIENKCFCGINPCPITIWRKN